MSESAKAIFLSYASQDAAIASRICDALRAAGLEVWFDQSELRGGDAWDASIKKQVRACALFVPLISANTDSRSEGYFRREWNLAVNRMQDMADDQAFVVPVVIDDTRQATARVPDRFRERQWSRLKGGAVSSEWVERVRELLAERPEPPPELAAVPGVAAADGSRKRALWLAIGGLAVVAIASAVAIVLWNSGVARNAPPVPSVAAGAPVADRKSIAVLPFDNLSGRAEDAYLADGLQEEILNALARLRDFKVISRTSVMEYRGKTHNVRDIGQRLGVGTILEGSIRRDGNTLRLTVQLVDARDDRHLLAANYDRDLAHVLDLQSAVARLVAESLSATLSRYERGELDRVATNSGDAYDRYLRAVARFRRPIPDDPLGLVEPKRLLAEALRFDPDFAEALALQSRAYTWTYFDSLRPEDGAAARKAFERALAIDPQLAEARLARGLYAMYVAADLRQALDDLSAVVRLRPSSAEAHVVLGFALRRQGRMEEALEHQMLASDLDPLNENYAGAPVVTLLGLRRYPEAIERTRIYQNRIPNDPEPHFMRARMEAFLQHSIEPLRIALRDHGERLDPRSRNGVKAEIALAEGRYIDAAALLESSASEPGIASLELEGSRGFLYLAAGDKRRAEQSFRSAERGGLAALERNPGLAGQSEFAIALALVQSMLGEHAAALATIETGRAKNPETRDATNGPQVSFFRSIILVRAGRGEEGYAEVTRLLRTPFGTPAVLLYGFDPALIQLKDDPHYDELLNRPPRL